MTSVYKKQHAKVDEHLHCPHSMLIMLACLLQVLPYWRAAADAAGSRKVSHALAPCAKNVVFPKIRSTFFFLGGVPIIRTIVFGVCIGVPLFWGTTNCSKKAATQVLVTSQRPIGSLTRKRKHTKNSVQETKRTWHHHSSKLQMSWRSSCRLLRVSQSYIRAQGIASRLL